MKYGGIAMTRKLSTMGLACLMALVMLNACCGFALAEELEPVELTVWLNDAVGTADQEVTDYINNLEEIKALNVTIHFRKAISGEDNAQAIGLALSSGEPCDIVFDAMWKSYLLRVSEGAYIDLAPYLEKYTALKEAIPQTHWDAATVNGGIYAVPTYKEAATQWAVYLPTSFVEANDIDVSAVSGLSDLTNILQMVVDDGRPGMMVTYDNENLVSMSRFHDFSSVAANGTVVVNREDPTVAVNYFETEEFRAFCELMKLWNESGYFVDDLVTRENYDEFEDESMRGMSTVSYSPQNEIIQSTNAGYPMTPIPVTDAFVETGACMGSAFCVTSQCENPDRAVAFLEVWNTVPAVKNAICYGVEGLTYNLVDGQVELVPDSYELWGGQNWTTGNSFISYTLVGETKDKWDVYLAWNESAKVDPLLGFNYDGANTSAEVAALSAALAEHLGVLQFGMVDDIDASIQALNDALYASGLETVLEDAQEQLDAFFASKE